MPKTCKIFNENLLHHSTTNSTRNHGKDCAQQADINSYYYY